MYVLRLREANAMVSNIIIIIIIIIIITNKCQNTCNIEINITFPEP
jgi:hypothetical protein